MRPELVEKAEEAGRAIRGLRRERDIYREALKEIASIPTDRADAYKVVEYARRILELGAGDDAS